ncbi:MAG: glycosyl hydrolase family 18 protein [Luteimonas sp.]
MHPLTNRASLGAGLALLALLAAQAAIRTPNVAPVSTITAPSANAGFASGSPITISANASDADGSVARVDFYDGSNLLGRDTTAPYAVLWQGAGIGKHVLTAVAVDNRKAKGTSSPVTISVTASSDTIAPSVPTGLAVTSRTSNSIALQWNAASDNVGGSGVIGYDVFRNGVQIASVAITSFTDIGLAAATGYDYTVRSRDAAGNLSSQGPAVVATTAAAGISAAKRVAGYFTQWGIYSTQYFVRTLEASGSAARLTHLNYAFGNVRNNRCEVGVLKATDPATGEGGDAYADYSRTFTASESVDGVADIWGQPLRGNWNQLKKLKARHPGLKVLLSLGGWTWSRGFASAARPENRQAFVASCIDAYIRGNLPAFDAAGGAGAAAGIFDGFDIDWEYPAACGMTCGNAEDTDNYTALMVEFRRQLDALRPGLELSATIGAGIDKIRVTRPELYHPYVNAINVMSYDFHGDWESSTNFHSALFNSPNDPSTGDARYYNTNDAIQALLARGVPASKLNVGMTSYGRGWSNVGSTNHGLYQSGIAAASSEEPGIESYRVLKTLGWPVYVDANAKTRWIYNGNTFWSFDDPLVIADKMSYAQLQALGGAFLWDFSGDDAQGSLVAAMSNGLK